MRMEWGAKIAFLWCHFPNELSCPFKTWLPQQDAPWSKGSLHHRRQQVLGSLAALPRASKRPSEWQAAENRNTIKYAQPYGWRGRFRRHRDFAGLWGKNEIMYMKEIFKKFFAYLFLLLLLKLRVPFKEGLKHSSNVICTLQFSTKIEEYYNNKSRLI